MTGAWSIPPNPVHLKHKFQSNNYLYLSSISSCDIRDCPTRFFLDTFFVILQEKLVETREDLIVNYKLKKKKNNNLKNDQRKESTTFSMEICMHTLACKRENSSNHFNYTSLVT